LLRMRVSAREGCPRRPVGRRLRVAHGHSIRSSANLLDDGELRLRPVGSIARAHAGRGHWMAASGALVPLGCVERCLLAARRIASIVAMRQSAMPTTNPEPVREKLTCPVCKGPLRRVEHGAWGGRRFHAELEVFDCPQHGAIYLTREGVPGPGPN